MKHYIEWTIETDDESFDIEVEFHFVGRYYPATLTEPAEYPELEILSIIREGKEFDPGEDEENRIRSWIYEQDWQPEE